MAGEVLPYFPETRPDEALYSILARFERINCSAGHKATMHQLYGAPGAMATIDLPNRIEALAQKIPKERGLTAEVIIRDHTLLPYYAAFQPDEIARRAEATMARGSGSLHLVLGLTASTFRPPTHLRFCPECIPLMVTDWGTLHWRRDHQLPSVLVCPDHGCRLRASTINLNRAERHHYAPAVPSVCPANAEPVTGPLKAALRDSLLHLARASAALLRTPCQPFSLAEQTASYRIALAEAGFMRSSRRVDQEKLRSAIVDFHGKTLSRLGKLGSLENEGSWLATLTRKLRKSVHPVQHLLLQSFLEGRKVIGSPFGSDPTPCRNPVAGHYGEALARCLFYYRNRGSLVGVFGCQCGYEYTRGMSPNGKMGRPRFRAFGSAFEPALRRLLEERGSQRSVARALGLDPRTLLRLAAEAKVTTPWRWAGSLPERDAEDVELVSARVTVQRSFPRSRRDWSQVDRNYATDLRTASSRVRAAKPPQRVTLAALERELGHRNWLTKRRALLPISVQTASDLHESLESFRRRRIRWHAALALRDLTGLKRCQVLRAAGLRSDLMPLVDEELASLTSTLNWKKTAAA
jgi:hypothetical protein